MLYHCEFTDKNNKNPVDRELITINWVSSTLWIDKAVNFITIQFQKPSHIFSEHV